jgi:hypothetical protein
MMPGAKTTIVIGLLAGAAYWLAVRPAMLRWGATDAEAAATLPGDDLVPDPTLMSTRAITIDAPVEAVWPWLVQIGQGRAGFYSYTWLENIFTAQMKNADRVVREWQQLAVGDHVHLHPKVALPVLEVEAGRHIVLKDDWSFVLRPIDDHTTRFIVRGRGVYTLPDITNPILRFIYWRLIFEPAHFIMERGMLLGLKKRAERAYRSAAAQEGLAAQREPVPALEADR